VNLRKVSAAAVMLAAISSCSEPADRGLVTSSEFGADWPFTVARGRLGCDRGAVTISVDGRVYALNDNARAQGWPAPEELLAAELRLDAAGTSEGKKSTKPLLERGLRLCGPPLVPGG
jgi:hypothetical protein